MNKYEIVKINDVEVTLDLSLFYKTEELYFNATEVAKAFGKDVREWTKSQEVKDYLMAILEEYPSLNEGNSPQLEFGKLIKSSRGRYGGTYLHNILALPFARWCSAKIAVKLDKFLIEKIRKEQFRKAKRLEAKTGYKPMTDAINEAHNPVMFYHFSNEADLLNKIIKGKTSKQLKDEYDTENVRECYCAQEVYALENLQRINTALIQLGESFEIRKEKLTKIYKEKFSFEAILKEAHLEIENKE